ncbi:MAG: DUF4900 domain-containing protein [Candidatus Eremiobacteraeota bacterium]|nr:DUF4900 domain-containing protein [Candidatus Eremiobacteraeota bacterium]
MSTTKRIKALNKSGSALLYTLLCIAMLSVITMGLAGISMTQSKISRDYYDSTKLLYVARAGMTRALSELARDSSWPSTSPYVGTLPFGGQTASYSITVTPAAGNSNNTYKVWEVTSSASLGNSNRTVRAIIESEALTKYVMFTDSAMWLWGRSETSDSYNGPIHTNKYFGFWGKPEFDSPLTSSNKDDSYYNSEKRKYTQDEYVTYDPSLFYHYVFGYSYDEPIASTGSNNFYFAGGQPEKYLSTNTTSQEANATYIIAGNATVTFLDAGGVEVVTESGTQIYSTDKVTLYINGTVQVSGTVNGEVTLACSDEVYITDNLVYSDKTLDVLAIVAEGNIMLYTEPEDIRDIEINAMLYSLNGNFSVNRFYEGAPRGVLYLYGGVFQKNQGGIGKCDTWTGELEHGYSKNFVLDPRFLSRPPDNIPVTGRIRIKAWRDNVAPLYIN